MIDTSSIDLAGLIEIEAGVRLGGEHGNGDKRTRKGPCPWCGGTHRFAVFVNGDPQHYFCGIHGDGCGASGDAITFIRQWYNCDLQEACERLGIDPGAEYQPSGKKKAPEDVAPVDQWQAVGMAFCEECKAFLWGDAPAARAALAYLREKRHLTDATIKAAGLGYNATTRWAEPEEWGISQEKKIWLPRGVTIPWRVLGNLWAINIRRGDKDVEADMERQRQRGIEKPSKKKYVQVAGGSNGLYNHDFINPDRPLVVVEGEFDAMILRQALGAQCSVVATGGASRGRGDRWVKAIASVPVKIWGADTDDAGHQSAATWRQAAGGVKVNPWSHDFTDMVAAGQDLQAWFDVALALAQSASGAENKEDHDTFYNPLPVVPAPPPAVDYLKPSGTEYQATEPEVLASVPTRCQVCGADMEEAATAFPGLDFHYSEDGQVVWCATHWPPAVAARQRQVQIEFEQAELARKEEVATWYLKGGYPVPVPQLGPDGFMVVPMPEEIKALIRGKKVAELPRCAGGCDRMPTEQDASGRYCPRCWDRRQGILADAMAAGATVNWASVEYLKGGFTGQGQPTWRQCLEALGDVTLHMVAGAARRAHQAQPVELKKPAARKLA